MSHDDVAYYNGQYLPLSEVRIAPDDRGWLFGDGGYEGVASYHGRIRAWRLHERRLRRTLAGLQIAGVDPATLYPVALELLRRHSLDTAPRALLYFQVTRGAAPRSHAFPPGTVAPTVFATVRRFSPPTQDSSGVAVITHRDRRWGRCDLKTLNLLPNCLAKQAAVERGAYEALQIRRGYLTEGTHTNVFVVKGSEVLTPPRSSAILNGVTRRLVIQLCDLLQVPLRQGPVSVSQLRDANEVFLTGTTTEIAGVVRVDDAVIGGGCPGPITMRIQREYQRIFGAAR